MPDIGLVPANTTTERAKKSCGGIIVRMEATLTAPPRKLRHPCIERRKGVCGGKPAIAGTRIKVTQVAAEYERLGWTPDEIADAHPHLRLEQVHDALSYYYENRTELDAEIYSEEKLVAELQQRYPPKAVRGCLWSGTVSWLK